jgi:hypothetical protein
VLSKKKRKQDIVDKILTFFEEKMRDASLRDLAFLTAWLASSYLAYSGLKGLKKLPRQFFQPGLPALQDVTVIQDVLSEDPVAFAVSIVAGYKLVTTDISDVASIASSLALGLG